MQSFPCKAWTEAHAHHGTQMQNHEIHCLEWRIALEKSNPDGIYQNLAYMYLALFSTEGTTFGAFNCDY